MNKVSRLLIHLFTSLLVTLERYGEWLTALESETGVWHPYHWME